MAAHIDLGARTPGEEIACSPLDQANSSDRGAGGNAIKEPIRSPQKDRNFLKQLLHNLMLALGAWHV